MNPPKSVGFEIKTLANTIKRFLDANATKNVLSELTGTQIMTIMFIASHSESDVFQRDIEQKFDIRRPTATGILKRLEENDLIKREHVPYDERLKRIILTDKAAEVLSTMKTVHMLMETKLISKVSPEELNVFLCVVEKMKQGLQH